MSTAEKAEQINSRQFQKLKNVCTLQTIEDRHIFTIQLTTSQANAINKLLPKSFVLNISKFKPKRILKRAFTLEKKTNRSVQQRSEKSSQSIKKIQQPEQKTIQEIHYDQMIRKCSRILNTLFKTKCSWPFRQPVDPIALGIPHYKDIITNPMDLRTIGQNISQHKYSTISQFYADIQLIISNSNTFNQNNHQFLELTAEFEKQFQKLKGEPLLNIGRPATKHILPPVQISSLTQRKKNEKKPSLDLAKRKQLAAKLKNLTKDELSELVISLNYNQDSKQLNLQILPEQKVKDLQEYLIKKQANQLMKPSSKAKQPMKKTVQKEESSFESVSDS